MLARRSRQGVAVAPSVRLLLANSRHSPAPQKSNPIFAMSPKELEQLVLEQMTTYVAEYRPPVHHGFGGNPWSKDRVALEVEKMRAFLVEPRPAKYSIDVRHRLNDPSATPDVRPCWVVADDGAHLLIFDESLYESALVVDQLNDGLVCWGIQGNAPECFISR